MVPLPKLPVWKLAQRKVEAEPKGYWLHSKPEKEQKTLSFLKTLMAHIFFWYTTYLRNFKIIVSRNNIIDLLNYQMSFIDLVMEPLTLSSSFESLANEGGSGNLIWLKSALTPCHVLMDQDCPWGLVQWSNPFWKVVFCCRTVVVTADILPSMSIMTKNTKSRSTNRWHLIFLSLYSQSSRLFYYCTSNSSKSVKYRVTC